MLLRHITPSKTFTTSYVPRAYLPLMVWDGPRQCAVHEQTMPGRWRVCRHDAPQWHLPSAHASAMAHTWLTRDVVAPKGSFQSCSCRVVVRVEPSKPRLRSARAQPLLTSASISAHIRTQRTAPMSEGPRKKQPGDIIIELFCSSVHCPYFPTYASRTAHSSYVRLHRRR